MSTNEALRHTYGLRAHHRISHACFAHMHDLEINSLEHP